MANQEELFSKWLVTTRCGSLTGVYIVHARIQPANLSNPFTGRDTTEVDTTPNPSLGCQIRLLPMECI